MLSGAKHDIIQLALIEDKAKVRDSLNALINGMERFRMCGLFSEGGVKTEQRLRAQPPDVLLLDIELSPGKDEGLLLLPKLRHLFQRIQAKTKIVMYTRHEDSARLVTALELGAAGYVCKSAPAIQLLESIREAHEEGACSMSCGVARELLRLFREKGASRASLETLSKREMEVLECIAEGLTNKEVGQRLDISARTVGAHLQSMYEKLNVHSRTEAARHYYRVM